MKIKILDAKAAFHTLKPYVIFNAERSGINQFLSRNSRVQIRKRVKIRSPE